MSGYTIRQISPVFLRNNSGRDQVIVRRYTAGNVDSAAEYIKKLSPPFVGISLHCSATGNVKAIAFATPHEVVWVPTEKLAPASASATCLGELLRSMFICLASFDMVHVALHIYKDLGLHVRGVDMSTLIAPSARSPFSPSEFAAKIGLSLSSGKLDELWDSSNEDDACRRAFVTARFAEACERDLEHVSKVKTATLPDYQIRCLVNLIWERRQLRVQQPLMRETDFSRIDGAEEGPIINNTRYKTRARPGSKTTIEMQMEDGSSVHTKAVAMRGKQTQLRLSGSARLGTVSKIVVHGREDLTCAENAFNEFVLFILMGQLSLDDSNFIRMLWFPKIASELRASGSLPSDIVDAKLNDSQRKAARAMVSADIPLCLVHGPPGTGKTTVIAAVAGIWALENKSAWIVAQSNVAVKNIAEALAKRNVNFKLIVSKEFHFEWHEHIYQRVEDSLIRSDDIGEDGYRILGDSSIILCTLSMISNPALTHKGIFNKVPLERLVIDEASQISVSEYMHVFHQFRSDLSKVCFFGDPCQLPPYGQESVKSLKSVFQLGHLRNPPYQYLLDTQYRMPTPLGEFISKEMYNGKLRSQHSIQELTCVRFVDVCRGGDEQHGTSWVNQNEAQTIVHLVRNYYRHYNFAIITPYDAQRNIVEGMLRADKLPWDKVFNVDSFQGNEADYVLISVTRTSGVGFLCSSKRINVMLTRCRRGMVIVASQGFLRFSSGRDTMVGRLSSHWMGRSGKATWVTWQSVAEGEADMPGVRGPFKLDLPGLSSSADSVHFPSPFSLSRSHTTLPPATSPAPPTEASPVVRKRYFQSQNDEEDEDTAGTQQQKPSGSPINTSPSTLNAREELRLGMLKQRSTVEPMINRVSTPTTVSPESVPTLDAFPVLGTAKPSSPRLVGAWGKSPPNKAKANDRRQSTRVLRIIQSPSSKVLSKDAKTD